MTTYAVHLGDLVGQCENLPLMGLLRPVLENRAIDMDPHLFAGVLVPFTCDDERAAAIVEVLRMKLRPDQLRMYISKTGRGGWKAV